MKLIQVEEALALLTTLKPNPPEVRIATIDTGVRGTHAALRDSYIGKYGWYDPYQLTSEPNDQFGHGTHTTGPTRGEVDAEIRGLNLHYKDGRLRELFLSSRLEIAVLRAHQWVLLQTAN